MTPLEVLGLKPGDTQEDAKNNFRRLSLLYHPDKHPDDEDAKKRFIEVVSAYRYITDNPSVLKKRSAPETNLVYAKISITVEDVYFGHPKDVQIVQEVPCGPCNGSGSRLKLEGICDLCGGSGSVGGRILRLMKGQKSYKCPSCGGSGVKPGTECSSCRGTGRKQAVQKYTVKVRPKDTIRGYIILPGRGSPQSRNRRGDLCVRIGIKNDFVYRFHRGALIREIMVSPAQTYVGDPSSVEIFGKWFEYNVPPAGEHVTLKDERDVFDEPRIILLTFDLMRPIITKETRPYYQKIVEIEKELLRKQEPISLDGLF